MSTKVISQEIKLLLSICLLVMASNSCAVHNDIKVKPNIVLILIDDLGWKDLSYMGSEYYETPNIDRLASKGMKFTNAYVTAPNCAPSRASLLTGQYTPRHNIFTVNNSERGETHRRRIIPIQNKTTLELNKVTIAEVLKKYGYKTASIGKWHLGKVPDYGPTAQGFDQNIGGNHIGHPKSYFSPYENKELPDKFEGEYLTDRLTDESIEFIRRNADHPFFLYLSHYGVHTPIQAKQDLITKYNKKEGNVHHNNSTYAAMIESVDQSVGRIMKELEELNLDNNTIIIFLSDNGGMGKVTSMFPLRGSKGMLYEGGIKVPMIISWQNKIKPYSSCSEDVISIDIFPTILSILGLELPDQQLDGISLTPLLLNNERINRDAIFWHFPAYLEGNYAGARDEFFRTRPCGVVKAKNWKLIQYFEKNEFELYNLEKDPGELNNLVESFPDKFKELKKLLSDWQLQVNAPIPHELNPDFTGKD